MFKITKDDFYLNWVKVTNKPMLNYIGLNSKWETAILFPSKMENRENRVQCIDENEWLFEIYFHWELQCIVRWYAEAKKYLQDLVDCEDYENGNQKDYWEFEID